MFLGQHRVNSGDVMDFYTAAIELVGLLILGIWIFIPIREFKEIFAKIRGQHDRPL